MSSRSTQATHASESAGLLHPFDVLHVVYTYLPDTLGGTEIYAKSLAAEQIKLGLNCAIAAPGARNEDYEIDGLKVARVAAALSTDQLYGAPNPDAQARWQHVLTALHPKILHVHARMPMLSSQTLDFARSLGCKIIYTTHTPSAFCARGTRLCARLRWQTFALAELNSRTVGTKHEACVTTERHHRKTHGRANPFVANNSISRC